MPDNHVNDGLAGLIGALEAEAQSLQGAETELRKQLQTEIEALARKRAFAYRRTRLMRLLVNTASITEEGDFAAAQRHAISDELGWDGESEANKKILDELARVGEAVCKAVRGDKPSGDAKSVRGALSGFEEWFEARHGKSFYALFDQYVTEAPVVDF